MSKDKILVMVYGSLKKGFYNHQWMIDAQGKFIGNAKSSEPKYKMVDINSSFPAIIFGNSYFEGEVYEVPIENVYEFLDVLEGFPILYNRGLINVDINGEQAEALVYFMNDNKNYFTHNSSHIKFENNTYNWVL